LIQLQLKEAQNELHETESTLRQSATFCGVLLQRLEELASFLSSLLQKKDISGNLSFELKKAITKAVDRSFDLSQNINISEMSANSQSLNLSQMSMIDLVDSLASSTFNDSMMADSLETFSFKTEQQPLQQNDNRMVKSNTPKSHKMQKSAKKTYTSFMLQQQQQHGDSDEDRWSEPDRDISKERMGINTGDEIFVKKRTSTTSEDDEDLNDFGSEHKLVKKSDWRLIHEKIKSFETMCQEKNDKILEITGMLLNAENDAKDKIIQIKNKLDETEKDLQHYRNVSHQLTNEKTNLESTLNEKDETIKTLKCDKEKINAELKALSSKFELQVDTNHEIRRKYEEVQNKLQNLKIEYESKCQIYDQLVTASEKREKTFNDDLQQNWIRKTVYNQLLHELEKKQDRLKDYQHKFSRMEEDLKMMQNQILVSEEKFEKISNNLDVATLQLSTASVERSKAINDKRMLETKLKKVNEDYHKLHIEKQELNLKIADLEVFNAKLQNKLLVGDKMHLYSPQSDASVGYVSEDANLLRSASFSSNDEKLHQMACSACNSCKKLASEMGEIRRNLNFSKHALEQAYAKLRNQNLRKAQIEMDIKQQILRTQNVLRSVKANMDSELQRAAPIQKTKSLSSYPITSDFD
jgi:centrosomin